MINKKGAFQRSHTEWVAMIVIMIIVYFAVYIALIPEESRQELLGEGEEKIEGAKEAFVLISESPGEVNPYTKETVKKYLPNVKLFSTLETGTIGLANTIYISRSIFSNNYKEFNFELEDLASIRDLGLFFHIKDGKGDIVLDINGNEIIAEDVDTSKLPIVIPKEYLKERNNLKIGAGSPGWMFLSKNYYDLNNINLIKRYEVKNIEDVRSFTLENIDEISDAKLSFYVSCMKVKDEQGFLKVFLNNHNIYFEKVACDANLKKIALDKDLFEEGINRLVLGIDKGDYAIERILLDAEMTSGYHPKYTFDLNEEDLKREIEVKMELSSGVKKGILLINGNRVYFSTEEDSYIKDISKLLRVGENYIKIIPDETFEIFNFKVSLK